MTRPDTRSPHFFRIFVLAGIIAAIASQHYLFEFSLTNSALHRFHYLLFLLPILISAVWYGQRGGIIVAFVVGILYVPAVIARVDLHGATSDAESILELGMFFLIGFVVGWLSDRERIERKESLRKTEELQKAQHLAAIGQMVSIVAHEIRNPLQNIQIGVDMIRREVGNNKDTSDVFEGIDYGIGLLNDIVGDLLDYSRPTNLCISPVPVGDIVRQAFDAISREFAYINVRQDIEQEDREIPIDAAKFSRVLMNIICNAADAMPEGGDLEIRSRFAEEHGSTFLLLSVTDNGCGIDEENLARIYEPFITTKPHGTGLGVPIAVRIVEAHGGKLSIRSAVNHGTTVEIALPTDMPAGTVRSIGICAADSCNSV